MAESNLRGTPGLEPDPLAPTAGDEGLRARLRASQGLPIGERLSMLVRAGELELPTPGRGATWTRFGALTEIAADDLSLARLAEGHADALAILNEAGEKPSPTVLYGVWAAGSATHDGGMPGRVGGLKQYCSGSGIIDHALITAEHNGERLLEVNTSSPGVAADETSWPAVGMAQSASMDVRFVDAPVLRQVGDIGFYQGRAGFWMGSLNVAAVWYGGALGLARSAREHALQRSPNLALLAELETAIMQMQLLMKAAANDTDLAPDRSPAHLELRALRIRHSIYAGSLDVLKLAAEIGGTEAATHDAAQARRLADLPVYLRQHHPSKDLSRAGELSLALANEGGALCRPKS
ncbi:MAG: acyl-CoA dehydrogenase [bacterium]